MRTSIFNYTLILITIVIFLWFIIAEFHSFKDSFNIPEYIPNVSIESINNPSTPKRNTLQLNNHNKNNIQNRKIKYNNIKNDISSAPRTTNKNRLSSLCPLRENLCILNNHWVTSNKEDVFNISELMFGAGIQEKYKSYRDNMYATYNPNILTSSKCLMINENIIILHYWYPHMLWEVWNRVAAQLFQYQIMEQFLSKNHRFAIMQLQNGFNLGTLHDLVLSPFTDYPFVHLKSLMYNQTKSLYPKDITKDPSFYDIVRYPDKLFKYEPMYRQNTECLCISETYWCGFDFTLPRSDIKQLRSIFDGTGQHEFGQFSWDMARWYKLYYMNTYGYVPDDMVLKKTKPRILFIQRRTWRRPWSNLNNTIKECIAESNQLFECDIIYFEDLSHIQTIWKMQLTDILVGVHGSGLVNGVFMNERSSVLEIVPAKAPNFAQQTGTIMTWIYSNVPQRHAWFPLLDNEQKHDLLSDYNKPFRLSWNRLKPAIQYLMETKHDFCNKVLPTHLRTMKFNVGTKDFNKKSPLYDYRPKCNSYEYLTM